MAYQKLSELTEKLQNPQKTDVFVKLFKAAVRDGMITATDIPERFTLPKMFSPRGSEGEYQRQQRDMIFEVTPKTEAWFEQTKAALTQSQRTRKVKPTVQAIESGAFDFAAAAEATRLRMQKKFEKGQQLGQSRAKTAKKK